MVIVFIGLLTAELAVGTEFIMNRPYLLALPFLPLLFLGLSARLDYGVVAILFCMVAIKFGVSTGTASKIPASLVIAGLWIGLQLVKMALDRNIRFVKSGLNLPALVFLAIVLASTFWSRFLIDPQVIINNRFLNVQIGTIAVTAISILLVIMCANLIREARVVRLCYWVLLGASLFYLPFYIFESLTGAGKNLSPDAITLQTLSRVINAGGLFPMWFCCLSLSLLLNAREELTRWQRFWITLAFVGWLFRLVVLTLVRISGWLPAVIAMLVVLFLYSRKWFFIFMASALLLSALNYGLIYDAIVVSKEKEGTLAGETSRTSLLQQALRVSQDHPLLGTGPAGYANYYMLYFRDLALSTHNNYLDMLLQYGVLGLGAFIWLCFAMIKEVWRASRLQPPGSFERAFAIGCFAGTIGMMPAMWLGDWVIPFAYNQTIAGFNYTALNWLLPGLALGLSYVKRYKAE